jgi:hypothetical protein
MLKVTSGGVEKEVVMTGFQSRVLRIGALALAPALLLTGGQVASSSADEVTVPVFTQTWSRSFSWGSISTSSPGVGVLDDQGISVIFGTTGGYAAALHVNDGSLVSGWPYKTKDKSITSSPSVLGSGSSAKVFFGIGTSSKPKTGGYAAFTANGKKAWYRQPHSLPSSSSSYRGVMTSMAVGNLQTGADVVGGAMGQMQLAMRASDGKTLKGFPWLMADTNFSSPAVAALYPTNPHDAIIEGGDSSKGVAYYKSYSNGGHIRILRPTGYSGKKYPNDGLVCEYKTNQVVQSSPAVGPFLTDQANGIVVGTGKYFSNASDTNKLIAINDRCKLQWKFLLDSRSLTSPALADVTGTGSLDVVTVSTAGTVYAINGEDGTEMWHNSLGRAADGSVTTFQAPDGSFQYILVPTHSGVFVLDGRTGDEVASFSNVYLRSSATVTADPDGHIGITVAGVYGGQAVVEHYIVEGSSVTTVQTKGSWPMFHHDPQLTGFAKESEPTS